ncbi:cytochrome C oxidase subunit IV family protein [Vreelandella salicampi]|uniref:Cytochrome C oxidase subunit IV family protein n=1 Tax=Vreelandella salicampi TaxID=1449798 RepID=A0A7Z0LJK9_9GAMM|nr:cytochrome C oxidase subunit IV family protein [Halomonas salicampi]NYS60135.1 cytochrome C oxidase subunit IV family protein [Halomonas salicampi]
MTDLPGTRRLLITWAILMGLTVVSMISARLDQTTDWQTLPLWSVSLVLLATGFKAHRVLMVYLNLRAATPAWKGVFIGLTLLTLALISAGYLAGRFNVMG